MRQPKIIRKDDLELVYIKGIQRQPIWVVKKCLSNLGIRHFYIRNVSFIGKDICELTVLKRSKPMIINILKVFENSFKVLENFNPVAVDNVSTANDEDILRVEKHATEEYLKLLIEKEVLIILRTSFLMLSRILNLPNLIFLRLRLLLFLMKLLLM